MTSNSGIKLGLRLVASCVLALSAMASLSGCDRWVQPKEATASSDADNWPNFGRTPGEQHFSPLTQISSRNVADLKLAWHYDLPAGNSLSGPVAADGKLFVTSGHSYIRAFEASTGKLLWQYDSKTLERVSDSIHIGWGSKGLAYWNKRIFIATTDGLIISLDADTGKELWKSRDFPANEPRYISGPPRVFDGKVIIGHGGADISPIRGYVTAYDALTGKQAWRFYTVPGDPSKAPENKAMEIAGKTWKGDWFGKGGGGTAWNAFTYDPDLNLIYIGVGNGFPYNQQLRSPGGGDNLFLASIVAVHADTGAYAWHYQVCPAEQWDCTATQDMTLATLKIDGKPRKVLMQAPKNGFFYVLDRATGELISAEKFSKVTWASGIDKKTGRPIENPGIRYQGKGMFELWPGTQGAHSWLPQAYSPQTGLVYIPEIQSGALIGPHTDGPGAEISAGMGVTIMPDPELADSRLSFLTAWDPVHQRAAWKHKLPGSWPGGVLATAGNLVFQGRMDGQLVAYDAKSGDKVWSFKTEAPIVAPPISYRVDGVQYVTVITGNGFTGGGILSTGNAAYNTDYQLPRRILTFALKGTDTIPALEAGTRKIPDDPDFKPDMARAQSGAILFGTRGCLVCHGWNAVGGGDAPDLRFSPVITNPQAFSAIVKDGGLVSNGMPAFGAFKPQELEDVRFYLRTRSKLAPAEIAALKQAIAARTGGKGGSFAGTWNLVISTPLGPQKAKAMLTVTGDKVSGQVVADQGSIAVAGTVSGDHATFSGNATKPMPMPMKVDYDLVVDGDSLSGKTKSGSFGTFPVTASRN